MAQRAATDARDVLFYDGSCALCHGAVVFVAARDPHHRFAFAPLEGETAVATLDADTRRTLPDSIVVRSHAGEVLVKSDAVLYVLNRIGGGWRVCGTVGGLVPRLVRDGVYDAVARVRYRTFGRTHDVCPMVPPDQRARFLP